MRFLRIVLLLVFSRVLPVLAQSVVPATPSDLPGKDCPEFTVPASWTEMGRSPDGSTRTYVTDADAERALSVLVRYFKASQETAMARAVQELKDLTLRGVAIVARPHPIKVGVVTWVSLEWEKVFFDAALGQTVNRGQQYYVKDPGGSVLLEVTFIGKKAAFEAFGAEGPVRFLGTCVWDLCEPPRASDLGLADAAELRKMGLQYFETGQYDRAIDIYGKALAKAGSNDERAEIYYLMGSAYLGKKDPAVYQQALDYTEKCLAILPRHWRAIMNKARIVMNLGDLEKADALFTEAESCVEEESPEAKELFAQHGALTSVLKMRSLKKKEVEAKGPAGSASSKE